MCWRHNVSRTWSLRVLGETEELTGSSKVFGAEHLTQPRETWERQCQRPSQLSLTASTAQASGRGRKRDGRYGKNEKLEKPVALYVAHLLFCEVDQTSWYGPWSRRERLILPACWPSSHPYLGRVGAGAGRRASPFDPMSALPSHVLHVVFKATLAKWAKLSLLVCIHISMERQEGKWTTTTKGRCSPICLALFVCFLVSTEDLVTQLWVLQCFQPRIPQPAPFIRDVGHSLYIFLIFFFLHTKHTHNEQITSKGTLSPTLTQRKGTK